MTSAEASTLEVLIVDDDPLLLRTLSDILRLRGYSAHTAPTGEDGLRIAQELGHPPAAALVDLRLPDMDGIQLVGALHAVSESIEVIILTGNASMDSAVQALRTASFDYLVKPVRPQELFQTLDKVRERWHRRVAEAAQRESERQLRAIFEAVGDAIVLSDGEGLVLTANEAALRLVDRPLEAVAGSPVATIFGRRSGTSRAGEPHGAGLSGEFTVSVAGGGERIVEVITSRFATDRFVHIARDLTERRRLEDQLHLSQKMHAVGRMAGGVAHDFNNILTAIRGFADLLAEKVPAPQAELDEIRAATDRGRALTHQLLSFSRGRAVVPRVVDLGAVLREAEPMLRRLVREDITLEMRIEPGPGHVRLDPTQLQQVALNLVVNACDAMEHGGELVIEAGRLAGRRPAAARGVSAEEVLVVRVRDTGMGIDADAREHIFDPFFTTKEPGRGTGLGLATVHGIVTQAGGTIDVESAPRRGTTFSIFLPATSESAAEGAEAGSSQAAPDARGAGEVILVVEDDANVRAVSSSILRRRGFSVIEAQDGESALAIIDAAEHPVQLVVTDVVMPGMTGWDLAARVRERRPGLGVLFTSGYAPEFAERHGAESAAHYLEKPFTARQLAARVRALLDG